MRVMIVDDEPLARQRLHRLLAQRVDIEVVGEAENGQQALAQFDRLAADLVLLDISMPGMDGLTVARQLAKRDPPPAVVFCTAFDEHAVAAFEARAVAYLLKPINAQRLFEVLDAARRLNQAQLKALNELPTSTARRELCAKTPQGLTTVAVAAVRYFYADQKYVAAVYPEGSLLLDDSLKELEEEFGEQLLRVHRNALVAKVHLQGLQRSGVGQYRARLQGIEKGPQVSRRHLASVRACIESGR